jgi:hypothetical protein
MNVKKTVLPLIAVGGVAAALFGGASVQTAFTSTASGSLNASTASIGTVLANGTVTLANAVPGDTGATSSVTITNQGSTPEALAVTFGSGSNAGLDAVVDVIWDGTDIGSLASLANVSFALGGSSLEPGGSSGDSLTVPVALMLDTSATDADANGSDSVSFTITGTATSANSAGCVDGELPGLLAGEAGVTQGSCSTTSATTAPVGGGWNRVTKTSSLPPITAS